MAYQWNQPYSNLLMDYEPVSQQQLAEAQNRARQIGAQSSAARGGGIARGAPLNTYNRLMSDYNLATDAENFNRRLRTQQANANVAALPQAITPTSGTQIASWLGKTVGEGLSPVIQQAARKGFEGLWGLGTKELNNLYTANAAGGPGYGFGGWEGGYGDVMPQAPSPDIMGMASQEYSPYSSLIEPTMEGFANIDVESLAPWWESVSDVSDLFGGFTGW